MFPKAGLATIARKPTWPKEDGSDTRDKGERARAVYSQAIWR